ncbi:hypothetical protein [Burkholderia lata]|uniref:hypothetical protein n=1 Tax=Burkholderia lata (strain ATCC 17760 / DSM 23089 / LMG 22485 / NCIMB 9086 / R18194 / 383) TaxID=482957 RepID=UPI001581BCE4|nr:hypothetical protein [Burkholderia lata]
MTTIIVQFSDSTEKQIASALSTHQDLIAWPNQGVVAPDDPRWAAYYAAMPPGIAAAWPVPTA